VLRIRVFMSVVTRYYVPALVAPFGLPNTISATRVKTSSDLPGAQQSVQTRSCRHIVAAGILPAAEPRNPARRITLAYALERSLLVSSVAPGGKMHALYGGQDARRYRQLRDASAGKVRIPVAAVATGGD